jgi:hypothetical protein
MAVLVLVYHPDRRMLIAWDELRTADDLEGVVHGLI